MSGNMDDERGLLGRCLRWALIGVGVLVVLLLVVFCIVFRTALYERYVLFPKEAKAFKQFAADEAKPLFDDGWNEYRGVLHAHSELSHDSAATQTEIVAALKKAKVDFICMSEHYDNDKADYSRGLHGVTDGILFIPGYELDHGFMPWGLPPTAVFNRSDEPHELGKKIHELGGVLFYAHCELERIWDLPELDGMEVYNIHPDLMDENYKELAPQILLNIGKYPDECFRLIFDPPTDNLKRWDSLNRTRHISGFAANDTHQNAGIRGFYTDKDTLVLKGTGEKTEIMKEIPLNAFTRTLLRVFCGPLRVNEQMFRFELDPYERSVRFVNTHILAKACTEKDVIDAIRVGRAFMCFNSLADGKGFVDFIEGSGGKQATMGESIPMEPGLKLKVAAPLQCRLTLFKDGEQIAQMEDSAMVYDITGPGKYRIQAELNFVGNWTPWIYANPIEVADKSH